MGQITKAFCEQMLVHAERKEHSPLTVWEEEQLARAWLRLVDLVAPPIEPASENLRPVIGEDGICQDHKQFACDQCRVLLAVYDSPKLVIENGSISLGCPQETIQRFVDRMVAAKLERSLALKDAELEAMRRDAERYREARNNPAGYVHLLNLLMKGGKGTADDLDKMMDRIAESRKNAAIRENEGRT